MKWPAGLSLQVVSLAAIGVLAFLLVGRCNRVSDLEAQAAHDGEARNMEREDLQRAKDATQRELNDRVRQVEYLRDYAEKLAAAGVKAKPVAAFSASTATLKPLVPITLHLGADTLDSVSRPGAPAPARSPSPGGEPACLGGRIVVPPGAVWETDAGNHSARANAEAWCADPEVKLFTGPLDIDTSFLSPHASGSSGAGWGGGLALALTRSGYALGPTIASPTFSVLGFRFEPSAALTLNPKSREWLATSQVILRRR